MLCGCVVDNAQPTELGLEKHILNRFQYCWYLSNTDTVNDKSYVRENLRGFR